MSNIETTDLLPQQMAPVTPAMQALTEQYLLPHLDVLTAGLQQIRHQVDARLKPAMPEFYGKLYPLGRCEPISRVALEMLPDALRAQAHPGMKVLHDFLLAGGEVRSIWGVLRGRYFQNAMQAGALYIDVANDTVDIKKPQIEILPLAESGMASVRDAAHCAAIAASYWEAKVYANHVVPALAPILPLLTVAPNQPPRLQLACDYMIALFMRDGFQDAEGWLASQPGPPEDVVQRLRADTPAHLLPLLPEQGRDQALAACAAARAAGRHLDQEWRDARVRDFLSIRLW